MTTSQPPFMIQILLFEDQKEYKILLNKRTFYDLQSTLELHQQLLFCAGGKNVKLLIY